MNNIKKYSKRLALAGVAIYGAAANAALTVPASIDTTDFMSVAGIVIVASAAMWGVKKAIGLIH